MEHLVLEVINKLIDQDQQEVLNALGKIPAWNEMVQQSVDE
jgi:hypothetical protein